jgi:phage shock protein A
MAKIEDALTGKKKELDSIQADINSLHEQAQVLKETVKKYNDLKKQESELRKEMAKKQKSYNTVIDFFKVADESYLTRIFPLFSELKEAANEA